MKFKTSLAYLALVLLSSISTYSQAQSLEDAVEFISCADEGWGPTCGYTAEFDNCTVAITSLRLGGILQLIHFDKVIWNSARLDLSSNNITANCKGSCLEDPEGIFEKFILTTHPEITLFVDDFKVNQTELRMGFIAAPQRVVNALEVVMARCPGVQSDF